MLGVGRFLAIRVLSVSHCLCNDQQTLTKHLLFYLHSNCLPPFESLKSLLPTSSFVFSWRWFQGEVSSILMSYSVSLNLPHVSVQFSSSVVSDSLRPHESQHTRPPVHHQLPEFTQTHVHRVGDAIQPSHPLSSPSPPAFSPSQHQGLFQWVNSLLEGAKVLEFQLQHQSFQWIPRADLL